MSGGLDGGRIGFPAFVFAALAACTQPSERVHGDTDGDDARDVVGDARDDGADGREADGADGDGDGGTAECLPGGRGCRGDLVVACDGDGHPTGAVIEDCVPDACVAGLCVDPCGPEALARSYSGCVFYAVDLPQWGQPLAGFGTIAANQQFAVAVANPWDVDMDVVVEQNDAAPGEAPIVTEAAAVTVGPNSLQEIPLPPREVSGYGGPGLSEPNRSMVTARAYRIRASRPATVYQFNPANNPNAFSNDASLLMPVNALSESYVALGWPGMGGINLPLIGLSDNRPFLTIVATQAGTRVRVVTSTPVMAGDGVPEILAGEEFVVTLGEFEALNLEGGNYARFGETDFTGTRVEADAPVAVWSGVECITVGEGCCCDHLEEQLFPRSSLGTEYVAVRSKARASEPDYFRILALDDGTSVETSLGGADRSLRWRRARCARSRAPATSRLLRARPSWSASSSRARTRPGEPAIRRSCWSRRWRSTGRATSS